MSKRRPRNSAGSGSKKPIFPRFVSNKTPNAQSQLLRAALSPVWGAGPGAENPKSQQASLRLAFKSEIGVAWQPLEENVIELLGHDELLGASLRPPGGTAGAARDVMMGLDFGTSSTKVVLADHSLNEAYAVPFNNSVGVSSYLLPSVLVETQTGEYSLDGVGKRHADLKLAMLSRPNDPVVCAQVCAFLALTIRRARSWMYQTKREQYLSSDILWTLAIGLPSEQAAYSKQTPHFQKLAEVAWSLAGSEGPLLLDDARRAWETRQELRLGDELEVRVLPELSAQIHGFVSSSHFDVRQPNIYLLVDVGAGTLDASLFKVTKEKDGRVSFSFFTHGVEKLGAANLNRARIQWWCMQLTKALGSLNGHMQKYNKPVLRVVEELEKLRFPTDFRGSYPRSFEDYIEGIRPAFFGSAKSPDEEFSIKVRKQVVGHVFYGAWKQLLLPKSDLKNIPFFLCGGGARHAMYESLKNSLRTTPNLSWLRARHRELTLPSNMSAPGVLRSDYDRLSVAYGLSQLNPGDFAKVGKMMPMVSDTSTLDLDELFIDKSAC